jgi:hypothetical protein
VETDDLEIAFTSYLWSGFTPATTGVMGEALARAGFSDEARALQQYAEFGPQSVYVTKMPPWTGRQCSCGPTPPEEARFGDLWFDPVELSLAVLVPNTPDSSDQAIVWISTHPVFAWQFRAFLRLVRRGRARTPLPFPNDYLCLPRFRGLAATQYVTDLYQDEALAYVRWFGKLLTSQLDLANAVSHLAPDALGVTFPADMRLWDGSEDIEDVRVAIGRNSVSRMPGEEIQLWMRGETAPDSVRMVYGEWERSPSIGCSTAMLPALRMNRGAFQHTAYFDLENTALCVIAHRGGEREEGKPREGDARL